MTLKVREKTYHQDKQTNKQKKTKRVRVRVRLRVRLRVRVRVRVRKLTVLALQASISKRSAFALCQAHTTRMLVGEKHYAADIEDKDPDLTPRKVDTKTPALELSPPPP